MSNNYHYTDLKESEIRLLWLLPAIKSDAALECEVEICQREKSSDYEAVSYVWGTDDNVYKTMKVHPTSSSPFEGNKNFLIRPNLDAALRRFRLTHDKRMLWSDTICINQDNDVEKSQQVPRMETTYSNAKKVLVWLGDETQTSSMAIDFMHRIVNGNSNVDDLVKDNARQWTAVDSLIRMPWFTRRWIVQEIALARDAVVCCGPHEIPWVDFCDAVTLFQQRYPEIKSTFLAPEFHYSRNYLGEVKALGACRLVEITSNLFRKSAEGIIQRRLVTLESLVSMLTMFDATRPHDIIYAMVAIAKDIKTVAQRERTVAHGALPVQTPQAIEEYESDHEHPRKKRKTTRRTPGVLRFRGAIREVLENVEIPIGLHDEEDRPRKGTARFQDVVHSVVRHSPSKFRVDYRQSFLRVCMDFVAFAIMQSESLDVICRPWVPEELKQEHKLPSWLIGTDSCAFRPRSGGTFVRVNADPLVGQNAMHSKRYSACGNRSRAQKLTRTSPNDGWGFGYYHRESDFEDEPGEHRSLFVNGFILDVIDEINDKAEDGTIPSDWFTFGGWHNRSLPPPDPFWRTLVADREPDGSFVQTYYQRTLRNIMHNLPARGSAFNVKAILATPQCDKTSERVLNRILEVTPNRRLFRTTASTDNVLGLAPAKARRGDLICILSGCSVPVILRRLQQQIGPRLCDYFELIGDAYVHGLMEGHALDEQIEHDIKSQQFEIR